MFIQVIQGQVTDVGKTREALEQWRRDLAPGAEGWLGSTAGVTDDGMFIALARFDSPDAARHNSERPEQDRWWGQVAKLFKDEPTFRDSSDVDVDMVGDPDRAGFVQVIQGRGTDPERARQIMAQDSDAWAAFRPDILGSVAVQHKDGEYTMAMYFTSEAEAREGERKEPPPRLKAQMDEMNEMNVGQPSFYDLKQPWLQSPE